MAQAPYEIHLDTKFAPLEHMDIQALANSVEPWWNQSLVNVNDCVVRLGVVHGDFHWHKHDNEDEFFYVIEGQFIIEIENSETITLNPGQGTMVPKGVMHCPHAPVRTVILMFEGAGVIPTGD